MYSVNSLDWMNETMALSGIDGGIGSTNGSHHQLHQHQNNAGPGLLQPQSISPSSMSLTVSTTASTPNNPSSPSPSPRSGGSVPVAANSRSGSGSGGEESKTNLIVNYLPQNMNQETVRALFQSIGEVESCKLIRERTEGVGGARLQGQSLGYGFVNFVRAEDAQRAINQLNGARIQNKVIKVSYARPSSEGIKGANLYVSGMPKTWTTAELENLFVSYGKIITSRILCDNLTGLSKGVGFVRFDQRVEAERAIQKLHGTVPDGFSEPVTVKFANNPSNNPKANPPLAAYISPSQMRRFPGPILPSNSPGSRFRYVPLSPLASCGRSLLINRGLQSTPLANDLLTAAAATNPLLANASPTSAATLRTSGFEIFVYNLAPETEESALWQLFGPFGAVQSVKVMRDAQSNKCRGYGFVTMTNYEEALLAIQALNGYPLASRILQVSFKRSKTPAGTPIIQ